MLREKRVAEEEFVSIDQDNAGLSAKRSGTCIPGVLCVIGVIWQLHCSHQSGLRSIRNSPHWSRYNDAGCGLWDRHSRSLALAQRSVHWFYQSDRDRCRFPDNAIL